MSATRGSTVQQIALGVVTLLALLAVFVGVGAAGWYAVRRIDPAITVAVIGAGGTIIVTTLTVVLGRIFERRKQIEAQQRAQWASMYEDFIRQWTRYMRLDQPEGKRKPQTPEEASKLIAPFSAKAMMWASPSVIKQWTAFKSQSVLQAKGQQPAGLQLLLLWEQLMLAMRKDLGHKDDDLADHELLRMFITDFDTGIQKELKSSDNT